MAWVVAGTAAFGIIAGGQQADNVRANAQITQQVAELNAKYADLDAYNASQAGITRADRYQQVIDATVGEQKTTMASKNVDVNFGTAAEVQAESKLTGFLNQLDIKTQANNVARGFSVQAMNYRLNGATGAAQAASTAEGIQSSSLLNGAGTLVSGYTKGRTNPGTGYNGDPGTYSGLDEISRGNV